MIAGYGLEPSWSCSMTSARWYRLRWPMSHWCGLGQGLEAQGDPNQAHPSGNLLPVPDKERQLRGDRLGHRGPHEPGHDDQGQRERIFSQAQAERSRHGEEYRTWLLGTLELT